MIEKGEKIPIDIESISSVGIDTWYDSFEWPITWSDFVEVEDKVKDIFNTKIDTNAELADIILINYKLYIEFSNYILALLLKKELGERAVYTPNNKYYKSIFEEGVPLPFIGFPKMRAPRKGIKNKLRKVKKYLSDNQFSFPKFWKSKVYILDESRSNHTVDYVQKAYKGRAYSLSFFDFCDQKTIKPISDTVSENITKLVGEIRDELCLFMESKGLVLAKEQKEFIFDHTFNLFTKTHVALEAVQRTLKKREVKLYIGSNNSYYSRIMSVAVRNKGGEIHGFKHGEPINYSYDLVSWLDLSLNDYFYEYTEVNVKMLKDIAEEFPPLNKNKCSIKSMGNAQYEKIFKDVKAPKEENITKVMLVGNRYRHSSFSSATAVFPTMQLYIELSIINKLKDQGYKVIYKMHPENFKSKVGYVNDLSVFRELFPDDVELNVENFETATSQVDAYAFYYTATSTFFAAFTSEKPIMLFDVRLRKYPKNMLDILSKRCNYELIKLNFIQKEAN